MGLRTKNGLATASIKTFGGLARTDTKTVQGLEVVHGPPAPPALTFDDYYDAVQLFYELEMGPEDELVLDTFPDRAGAFDLTATGLQQPTLLHDGTRPGVVFNGTTNYMFVDLAPDSSVTFQAFVAVKAATTAVAATPWATNGGVTLIVRPGGPTWSMYLSGDNHFGTATTSMMQASLLIKSGTNATVLRLNGVGTTVTPVATPERHVIVVGNYTDFTSFPFSGMLSILALGPEQSSGDGSLMEAYMTAAAVVS